MKERLLCQDILSPRPGASFLSKKESFSLMNYGVRPSSQIKSFF
ncbi:hypothetical protein PORCAN_166 [Porphyromonas crevioricanis JCM 13913]|nr:hypothetical protein PORCAN_166 [Porphyromonas crevioricanis JCM 13913]